jgi:UDP-N-acetylglucosamine/UDP-N-acetylgalactosamine diphosphorylase
MSIFPSLYYFPSSFQNQILLSNQDLLQQTDSFSRIFFSYKQQVAEEKATEPLSSLHAKILSAENDPQYPLELHQPVPRLGCLVLAGGQGTRLGWNHPKGTYPIAPSSQKSLFELFASSILAAQQHYQMQIPVAIMVSQENHEETSCFFRRNNFFGLEEGQVDFFQQTSLPIYTDEGLFILDEKGAMITGPSGNGELFKAFYESHIWEKWNREGVVGVQVFPVDNPLALPYDRPTLNLFQQLEQPSLVVRVVERADPEEAIGTMMGTSQGEMVVIEYSEISREQAFARVADGKLLHRWGYIGLVTFGMEFMRQAALGLTDRLPWHGAKKRYRAWSHDKEAVVLKHVEGIKLERFIFDLFPYAKEYGAVYLIPSDRARWFAPLKNAVGFASPEEVRAAMMRADRQQLVRLLGYEPVGLEEIELDRAYYYPTPELESQLRAKFARAQKSHSGFISAST